MARRTIYTGTFIHTPTPSAVEILNAAAVFVDETGTIVHIDRDSTLPSARINSDLGDWSGAEIVFTSRTRSEFFFPGFIDTHIHASQYPNVGIFGKSSLLDWLTTYTFPLEASLADPQKARRVYSRVIARTLANGTTTAAYYATRSSTSTNTLATLCHAAGQRALIGRCAMDRNAPSYYIDASAAAGLADTTECIAHCAAIDPDRKLITPIVTPRFAPSCSAELLSGLGKLAAREKLPVQTHVAENKAEIAWVAELFPEAESYTQLYDAHGLLGERTILAHGVHLTDSETALIAARGAGVSHCPVSNLALTSGMAKVKRLMRAGVKVGLGTDVSGGFSASVLETVRQATLVSNMVALMDGEDEKLSVAEALYLGTRGGAEVVGMGTKIGAFEVGMQWDAQLVGLENVPELDDDVDMEEASTTEEKGPAETEMSLDAETNGTLDAKTNGTPDAKTNGTSAPKPKKRCAPPPVKEPNAPISSGVELDAVDIFGWENWEERLVKWVYNGDERNTERVWVAGRMVYQKGGIPETWELDREE